MIDQIFVHHLRPLQLLQLLDQGIVAQDRPRQSQSVRGRARHVLDHLVLQLFQNLNENKMFRLICVNKFTSGAK